MLTIRRILVENPMSLLLPVAIFFVTFGAGWLARRLVMRALNAWTARTGTRTGLMLGNAFHGPMLIWAAILGVHLGLQSSDLPVRVTNWAAKGLLILWIISLTIICMRLAGSFVRYYGDQVPGALPVTTLTQNLAQLAVFLLGTVILLRAVGVEIAPILTALGVGGLAVALALQDTLSNLFGGFYVAVARQVRLGDYIKLNTNEEGYVTDIGWRSTTIRGLNNNMVIVPNAKLAQAIVINYYLPEKRMGCNVQVAVSYDADPEHVERVLLEIAAEGIREIPGMVGEPPPAVTFDPGFGDYSLGFTLGFQVAEFANQFGVRHQLRKRILRRFREEGLEMPIPARAVYMRSSRRARPPASVGEESRGSKE